MPVYILPLATAPAAELQALVERAGGEILTPDSLYDFVRATDYEALQFMSVSDELFTKIMRNVSDVTPKGELPKVLFGAPGYAPSPRIVPEANALVIEEWRNIEPSLMKSGLTSANKEEAQERSLGARRHIGAQTPESEQKMQNKLATYFTGEDKTKGKGKGMPDDFSAEDTGGQNDE